MARVPNANYRLAGQTFDLCTGADEPFRKPDYQFLNAALDDHDHTQDHGKAAARFGTGSVGADAFVDAAVTFPKLAANTVPATAFARYAVLPGGIAPGAIQAAITRDGPLVFGNYADRSITGPKFAPATITADRIQGGAPPATPVPDGSITTAKLADGAVIDAKVASGLPRASYPMARWMMHSYSLVGGSLHPSPWTLSFADGAWRADNPNQANPNLADHSVYYNGDIGDPAHWIDPFGSHPTRLAPTIAGIYRLEMTGGFSLGGTDAGTYGTLDLVKNGATVLQRGQAAEYGSPAQIFGPVTVATISLVRFNGSSDYVEWIISRSPASAPSDELKFDFGTLAIGWVST